MNIAAFTCSNGLGHSRRIIAISSFMYKYGFNGNLTVYMPLSYVNHMKKWPECKYFLNHPKIKLIDFIYPSLGQKKTNNLVDKNWASIQLPNLNDYDVVWSDNITQLLRYRTDTIITGSFLWYDVLKQYDSSIEIKDFIASQEDLFRSSKPKMIGNEYFAMPEVKNYSNFMPVGLYRFNTSLSKKNKKDILLSCGLGGEEAGLTKQALDQIIKDNIKPLRKLYVEPSLLNGDFPDWIKPARFNQKMFQNCVAVCIRPGMGTISESLVHGNRIFSFHNDNMMEMNYNSKVIEEMDLGKKCLNPIDAYENAISFSKINQKIKEQQYLTSHLRMDGIFKTAEMIINHIKE